MPFKIATLQNMIVGHIGSACLEKGTIVVVTMVERIQYNYNIGGHSGLILLKGTIETGGIGDHIR